MSAIQIETPAFLDQAACAGKDPDIWHPVKGGRKFASSAIAICRTCPVRVACFEWALTEVEQFGIWGGTTDRERRVIRRQRRLSTSPVDNSVGNTPEFLTATRSEHRIEA